LFVKYKLVSVSNVNKILNISDDNIYSDLLRMEEAMSLLLCGNSLNNISFAIFSKLKNEIQDIKELFGCKVEDISSRYLTLREWFFFALISQEYRSPAPKKGASVFQGGLLSLNAHIKYLRSEMNIPVFGDSYDRNVVMINSAKSYSFINLAAKYITMSPDKEAVWYLSGNGILKDFLEQGNTNRLVAVEIQNEGELSKFLDQIEDINSTKEKDFFRSGFYLKTGFIVENVFKERIQSQITRSGRSYQVLVEEPYDPYKSDSQRFRKVSFFHNMSDKLRYQLLQDAASMGYRPAIRDVVEYSYEASRLLPLLNTEIKTEDTIITWDENASRISGESNIREMQRDYQVLVDTVKISLASLQDTFLERSLNQDIRNILIVKFQMLGDKLNSVLSQEEPLLSDVRSVFHESYYALRSLVQFSAKIIDIERSSSYEEINRRLGVLDGSVVLTTNSGMTATRAVITCLAKLVSKAYTTPHYWETDFLIENIFSSNPHYSEECQGENRLERLATNSTKQEIDTMVEKVLAENAQCVGGQLLCLDQSISPFFYTKSFDLLHFCRMLDINSYRITNPVYLVVDNTMDFERITSSTLFPSGIPDNVFLIFTTSMAKMHQLGFDVTTGGVINLYASKHYVNKLEKIKSILEDGLVADGTIQDSYSQRLLELLFYQRYASGTMKNYLDFMVLKRQRNTGLLISSIRLGLNELLIQDKSERGLFIYKSPFDGSSELQIRDNIDSSKIHKVMFSFHYDPDSNIHAYLKIEEKDTDDYIAGRVFEEIKRRVFERAASKGISLADGTSWGFVVTRMDWYMHTLRIATGLQHNRNFQELGIIISGVINDLLVHPEDFLSGSEIVPMTDRLVAERSNQLLTLDRMIPHDPSNPTPISYYQKSNSGKADYSFVVDDGTKLVGMLYAYMQEDDEGKYIYISKAAVNPEYRQHRFFRRMLLRLWSRARQEGIDKIKLETSASESNANVIGAYERCGFKVTGLEYKLMDSGWPLIKVIMEANTSISPFEQATHFEPLPGDLYDKVHESGDLSLIEKYQPVSQ